METIALAHHGPLHSRRELLEKTEMVLFHLLQAAYEHAPLRSPSFVMSTTSREGRPLPTNLGKGGGPPRRSGQGRRPLPTRGKFTADLSSKSQAGEGHHLAWLTRHPHFRSDIVLW
ncbi:hypothetical protein NL676_002034 [Syzygium grande]|nr:hypothetical protein NL676_002034 [Syzygium grande]